MAVATLALAMAFGAHLPPAAAADTPFPARPIHLIVPQAPAGSVDIVSRKVAERMSARLGVPIVVENKAGAAGTIGTEAVKRAAPDGYTLLVASTNTHAMAPHVIPSLAYDPLADFTPVADLVHATKLLAVVASLPVRTLSELVAYAKANPVFYGSAGVGSSNHFDAEALIAATGVPMTHVPYRGSAASLLALVNGEIQVLITSPATFRPQIDAGKVRPIVAFTKLRLASLQNVPTIAEAGFADLELSTWTGIVAPAGTPPAVIATLNNAARQALANPEFVAWAQANEMDIAGGSPAEFGALMRADHARWGRLAKAIGIAAQASSDAGVPADQPRRP